MNKSILIIDSDADARCSLENMLAGRGYWVTALPDVRNIAETICECKPDLIIIEYLLHGINGGEICAQIKRDASFSHFPVLLTSNRPQVLQSLGTYGCNEVIVKPFSKEHILHRVRYYLEEKFRQPTAMPAGHAIFPKHPLL